VKYLPLIWAGIRRKPARTLFTALSISIAFLLIGLLEGVNAGFADAIRSARRDLLTTDARVRGGPPMPIAMMEEIRKVPGVVEVAQRAYFVGVYRPPYDVAAIATDPKRFFDLRPALAADPARVALLERTRAGILMTPALLKMYGLRIGDRVTLRSRELRLDGSGDWPFEVIGTFDAVRNPGTAAFAVMNYSYLDEARALNRGTAELFYVRIADPARSIATAAAIDRRFANSSHETRTRSDQERAEANTQQMGDIAFFTRAIMGAVLFTLFFLTANTMRQSLHERIPEFGVLKALGYAGAVCFAVALIEAVIIYGIAATLGLAVASTVEAFAGDLLATPIEVSWRLWAGAIGVATVLALLSVAVPSWRLYRITVVDALAGR
jgi:putative ABC transport system permease protein